MSLTENYLTSNGYDYFENAAEDTLVFFVRDHQAPFAESSSEKNGNEEDNTSSNVRKESGEGDMLTDFDSFQPSVPDADTSDEEWSQPVTSVAQKDEVKK